MTHIDSPPLAMQLKSDFVPLTVIQLKNPDLKKIEGQLATTLKQVPNYFSQTPVIIDAESVKNIKDLDMGGLCELLKKYKIVPVGIKGLPQAEKWRAEEQGLMCLSSTTIPKSPARAPKGTKIISQPIRSGTQIYARESDLVILSSVNVGAECMADGNIHIYGPLRGRALAGVSGNIHAHIFCKTVEAELIAIAGYYLVKENIVAPESSTGMYHIFLKAEQLHIEEI
jgi:septum site-determining protein MinC